MNGNKVRLEFAHEKTITRISRLLLTGDAVSTEGTAGFRLIAEIVDELDLGLNGCLQTECISRSPAALRFASRARLRIRCALNEDLPTLELMYLSELMAVPIATEGIHTFFEERQPQWRMPVPAKN